MGAPESRGFVLGGNLQGTIVIIEGRGEGMGEKVV